MAGVSGPCDVLYALHLHPTPTNSLLEAFTGFRFNLKEVEMGTRRPLIVQVSRAKMRSGVADCDASWQGCTGGGLTGDTTRKGHIMQHGHDLPTYPMQMVHDPLAREPRCRLQVRTEAGSLRAHCSIVTLHGC